MTVFRICGRGAVRVQRCSVQTGQNKRNAAGKQKVARPRSSFHACKHFCPWPAPIGAASSFQRGRRVSSHASSHAERAAARTHRQCVACTPTKAARSRTIGLNLPMVVNQRLEGEELVHSYTPSQLVGELEPATRTVQLVSKMKATRTKVRGKHSLRLCLG